MGSPEESERCMGVGVCVDVCPALARELCGRRMTVEQVMAEVLKERLFFDESNGGVTLTGGEPLSQPEFALALLEASKRYEIHTVIDTSGFVAPAVLLETVPLTGLYLYDVKIMDPERHKKYTGVDNEIILSNLKRLSEAGAAINARLPFIPGVNTDEENLRATGAFLEGMRGVTQLNLLPYHSVAADKHDRWKMKYKLDGATHTPTENMLRYAAGIIEEYGVRTVIGG